ncbi:FAD-dependent oxidoreductase [Halobaculum sp. CBA1158]|uniref:NAD(P)/FAD-dependent oxidoreductase n=1 Tax=Halobaculum sp. CBA1158 TaxID=2904243 RepID=UPI001F3C6185|nr:FAD-dependent oxidoreductase [Halobaculum sp. CBA1158]UIO99368.1 FAD-dependent oxidoreductase [Halobaculum sp. CBA1158]
MAHIGIVGAGLAGVGAAYALRESDHEVTLLEKSRGVGGRAATRRRNDCVYDHGANYVKERDDRTTDLIRELGEEGLVDEIGPVWTFERDGEIDPSDREEERKYTWEAGITQFAKRLLARTDADVHKTTRVESLARDPEDDAWTATDADGDDHGPFDAIVLTPPAPQTADLLRATDWPDDDGALEALATAVEDVPFRTIRTLVFGYDFSLDVPWYAAVNTDTEHEVGWLAREECKPGHVPDGETLLIAQMSPEWSSDHYDDSLEDAAEAGASLVAGLVDDGRLEDPEWVDDQGWRYALPNAGLDLDADDGARSRARDAGLYVAGDWVAGAGRVHEALWNGVDTGEAVADRL